MIRGISTASGIERLAIRPRERELREDTHGNGTFNAAVSMAQT